MKSYPIKNTHIIFFVGGVINLVLLPPDPANTWPYHLCTSGRSVSASASPSGNPSEKYVCSSADIFSHFL